MDGSGEIRDDNRYGLYRLTPDGPQRIAETSKEGIGPALVMLAEDRLELEIYVAEVIGVLDRQERWWVSGLWHPRTQT